MTYLFWSSSKQVLIAGWFCHIFIGVDIRGTSADVCAVRLEDGEVPCFGRIKSLRNEVVKDVNECCVEMRGRVFTNLAEGSWNCLVCQELLAEHVWLPSPPCDTDDCDYVPQRYLWFALSIPNRRIQCIGRSFKNVFHCQNNKTLCWVPEPTTDPVFCFKHRFRKFNSNSWGCPASSLDWELARDIKDCCVTRGGAGYAKHINEWYIDEAKLHKCMPCALNPSSDTTWSQWSPCSPGSKCARKRSLQIPYLENMPNHWCMETITMEEPTEVEGYVQFVTENESSCTTTLILAIIGLTVSSIVIGVVCFVYFRKRLQLRARSSATTSRLNTVSAVTEGGETNDGYLAPIKTPTAKHPMPRSIPEASEQIYERMSYYSTDGRAANVVLSSPANAAYMEMKEG